MTDNHNKKMGKFTGLLILFIIFLSSIAYGQSPYPNHLNREIKALSEKQQQQLINGEGMGLAIVAELNGYPGPLHVLEHKEKLALSEDQISATKQLFNSMNKEAIKIGRKLIKGEKQLELLFQTQEIEPQQIQSQVEAIGLIRGKLRSVHLLSHLEQKKILNEKQLSQYQHLRGYKKHQSNQQHHNYVNGLD